MNAFLPPAVVGVTTGRVELPLQSNSRGRVPRLPTLASRPRRMLCMAEKKPGKQFVTDGKAAAAPPPPQSSAERTRAALSASEPLVKFRKGVDMRSQTDTEFSYTSGTSNGGIDVWLISTVLLFLVPVVVFAVGVGTGYIDISPR